MKTSESGKLIEVKPVFSKALKPMVVREFPKCTVFNEVQPWNARGSISVTESGTTMELNEVQELKRSKGINLML